METGDPDNFITFIFLLGHPIVHFKGGTVVPATQDQIGLLYYVLHRFNRNDFPLDVFNINAKPPLLKFDLKISEDMCRNQSVEPLDRSAVLLTHCDEHTLIISGEALKNVAKAFENGQFKLGRLVGQGGFADDNIVPEDKRLEKFHGRLTCPTFDLSVDTKSVEIVLDYNDIKEIYFVTKNVCHGVIYTK